MTAARNAGPLDRRTSQTHKPLTGILDKRGEVALAARFIEPEQITNPEKGIAKLPLEIRLARRGPGYIGVRGENDFEQRRQFLVRRHCAEAGVTKCLDYAYHLCSYSLSPRAFL
jgi:hypothetical protein